MAKYNGIELPNLPEYDPAAYPRAYIVRLTVAGEYAMALVDGSATIAHSNADYAQDTGVILFAGVTASKTYQVADGAWVEITAGDVGGTGISYILRPEMLTPVWSNFDIPKADGTIYLAASEPVGNTWSGLKSWLIGFVLGLAGKPLPLGTGEKESEGVADDG